MKIGIFGLPLSGKTTVFRLLAGWGEHSGRDTHGEAQTAVLKLPDERLDFLTELYDARKTTPAEVALVDTVALRKGQADTEQAESLTELLGDADAFLLVIRGFDLSGDAGAAAADDLDSLLVELALTDLPTFERRRRRLEKELRSGKKEATAEHELCTRCAQHLESGGLLRTLPLTEEEAKTLRGFKLLTLKPMLVVANVGEDQAGADPLAPGGLLAALGAECDRLGLARLAFSAALEAEIEGLDPAEQETFRSDYGITRPARARFVEACFGLLGLVMFFTAGEKEVRAYTVPSGSTAVDAAGRVHTDMARGFIRAEVVSCEHLREAGSLAECRRRGTARLEGKDYPVRDGDVLLIRFSI